MKHLVCCGFGFSAKTLAARLDANSWRVTGTSRSAEGVEKIVASGYEGAVFDGALASTDLNHALQTATHLLVSVVPGETADPLYAHHVAEISTAPQLEWIGYLSTVGVYGDHAGRWIDETTPVAPASERSKRRHAAEQAWMKLDGVRKPGSPRVQVFRLPGIYGPGRSAIDQILAGRGRRVIKPGQVFNRIHVDDIAGTLEAAIENGGNHNVYNVTDDEPAPPQDVIALAAELMGKPIPPGIAFEDANLSAMGRSFYSEVKRVRNDRIKTDLGVQLEYPTYREGLAAISAHLRG